MSLLTFAQKLRRLVSSKPQRPTAATKRRQFQLERLEDRSVPAVIFGSTPALTVSDGGGRVLPSVHVELIFWGSQWNTAANQQYANQIQSAVDSILAGHYMDGLSQYRNISHGVRDGSLFITSSSPGTNFTNSDVKAMLKTQLEAHNIPNIGNQGNRLYFVITQPNSTDPTEGLGGEHSQLTWVTNSIFGIPLTTESTAYGWAINDGKLDTVTYFFSHELAESVTDPAGTAIQINPRNSSSWNEVSDGVNQNFSYRLNGIQVQSYWSARDHAPIVSDGNVQNFKLINGVLSVTGDQLGNNFNDNILIDKTAQGGVLVSMNGETVQFDPGKVNTINVQTLGGTNTVNVASTLLGVTVNINGGINSKDTVTIGSSGSLANIAGPVNVSNSSGQTSLVVDDSADTTARSATISNSAVTGLSVGAIHYTGAYLNANHSPIGVAALKVNGGSGGNTFDVLSTAAQTPVDLNSGLGNDTVLVRGNSSALNIQGSSGTDTVRLGYRGLLISPVLTTALKAQLTPIIRFPYLSGSMVNLTAPVNVSNTSGKTSLVLDDSGDAVGRTINLSSTQVTGMSPGAITYGTGVTSLSINAGLGADRLNVLSLPSNTAVAFNGGLGLNTLAGPNVASTWSIISSNAGLMNGMSFLNVQNLRGGSDNDVFSIADGKGVTGTIDGGFGFDFMDYTAWTTPVVVNLATGTSTGIGLGINKIEGVLGGNGDNTLIGNSSNNILVGGSGDDKLSGGTGRSILIGGKGTDDLKAGTGDSLMIGGQTKYDSTTAALISLMNEWQRTDINYLQRVDHLRNGGGLNGSNTLSLGSTVLDDGLSNSLTGNLGADWFFQGANDLLFGLQPGELIN